MASYDKAELAADFDNRCHYGSSPNEKAMDFDEVDKWFRDAKVYSKTLTSTDTKITFSEVKDKTARKINFQQFLKLCGELGKKYGDGNEIIATLISNKSMGATSTSETGGRRLVDTSKHKGPYSERSDESGKGKGYDGRADFDAKAGSGYVGGYK